MSALWLKGDMPIAELRYESKQFGTVVRFLPKVVWHFHTHRQRGRGKTEQGGQLFAQFVEDEIRVVRATGPNAADKRGRAWFRPDQSAQNVEIKRLFEEKLHFVGDWHTHPEGDPHPSSWDFESMKDCFTRSRHELKAFLMVVIGLDEFPTGLWVSLHGSDRWERLQVKK